MSYGSGARFQIQRFLRDLTRSQGTVNEDVRQVPSENFFNERWPGEIIQRTIGLRAYAAYVSNPATPPEALVSVCAAVPPGGMHSILSSNVLGSLRQLTELGSVRGRYRAPELAPWAAHLRYLWLQWEHDTTRVHSRQHLAAWAPEIPPEALSALVPASDVEVEGVEPWYGEGGDTEVERNRWAWDMLAGWVEHQLCRGCLDYFIQTAMPSYVFEEVHCLLADVIERFSWGWEKGIILNVAPRAGKSQQASIFAPPWQIAEEPWHHLMSISYARTLSSRFGAQARALLLAPWYQRLFPHVELAKSESGEWMLRHGNLMHPPGEFYASGVEGGIAGRGFTLGINDDLLNEQTMYSTLAKDKAWDWWFSGFLTRKMDPDRSGVGVIATRYAADDPIGRLLQDPEERRHWRLVKIPALLKTQEQADLLNSYRLQALKLRQRRENLFALASRRAPQRVEPAARYEIGSSFSPIRRSRQALERVRATTPSLVWSALYDQEPSQDEGNIILRSWWRPWKQEKPPFCRMIIAMYDTAYEEDESADYSARTTWGLFEWEGTYRIILLEAWRGRVSFPTLKKELLLHHKHYRNDLILVEKKASGASLVQDLQQSVAPVKAWLPSGELLGRRAKGKVPRMAAASTVFEAGLVYYMDRRWAHKVIDETAQFPNAEHDDWSDTVSATALWFRENVNLFVRGDYDPKRDDDPEDDSDLVDPANMSARERAVLMLSRRHGS